LLKLYDFLLYELFTIAMITDIRLQHFRSYTDAAFEFDKGANIIVGPNASGKTNLLEALLIIAHGASYRAGTEELIQFKKPWARLEAHTPEGARIVKLSRQDDNAKKTFEINHKPFTRLSLERAIP